MVYFVATPIGNLKDITYRAIETLQNADVIFCEDTRHSLKLLNAYDIKKPLLSCHKFNETEAAEKIVAAAREGKEVAIVSDAGMPVISDPGSIVCRALKEAGIQYTVIPGANAALSALILSAFPADRFAFIGFLPDKAKDRMELLAKYAAFEGTLIFYVAPQDIQKDVQSMYEAFGERSACAVREITKIHEESIPFTLSQGFTQEPRGEFVVVVEGLTRPEENPLNKLPEKEHIQYYMGQGMDKKEAVKQAAKDRGVPKSEMYKYSLDL
ncbi:MAG: 16S rRNA (cytidine(1402)-2'-O)-methyltransferase [Clostridia bacterium]|nr:16S rRNA (cytidine(1402)-2'-O)-methyltransferase [Clostridia bacterium]